MNRDSSPVISTQSGIHKNLTKTVRKHLAMPFRKPAPDHSVRTFKTLQAIVSSTTQPLVLDAGCGTGDSTRKLARQHPDCFVIGIDKSASRLSRERKLPDPENMTLIKADMLDFYPLMAEARWQLTCHYLLYPNPWPKPEHLQRRWHGSPVFPALVRLGGKLELRTNWQIYAEEFCEALHLCGQMPSFAEHIPADDHISLFEKKYDQSGHTLFKVTTDRRVER